MPSFQIGKTWQSNLTNKFENLIQAANVKSSTRGYYWRLDSFYLNNFMQRIPEMAYLQNKIMSIKLINFNYLTVARCIQNVLKENLSNFISWKKSATGTNFVFRLETLHGESVIVFLFSKFFFKTFKRKCKAEVLKPCYVTRSVLAGWRTVDSGLGCVRTCPGM
jgi:hypothetical protein